MPHVYSMTLHRRWLPCATLLFIAACSSDVTGPAPQQEFVSTLLSEVGIAGVAGALGGVVAVPLTSTGLVSCSYVASSQRFVCTPFTAHGLTFEREYALYDEGGNSLSMPEPSRVATLRQWLHLSGTLTVAAASGVTSPTIDRREDMTLSGLKASRHTLNGTATSTSSATLTYDGSTTTMTFSQADTTRDVVFAPPTAATAGQPTWPLGGSITSWTRYHASGQPEARFGTKIEFSGTSLVTITTWGSQGSRTCTIDLAKPIVASGTPAGACY